MDGIDPLGLVSGIGLIVVGVGLMVCGLFFAPIAIYGVIGFILGVVLLKTLKKQEEIELIKTIKKKGDQKKV